jgi:metallo-beta-lactamase family protein
LKRVRRLQYGETIRLGRSVSISFIPAGHILGSGFVAADVREPGKRPTRIIFSGDIGRYDEPILNDPFPVEGGDYLVVESTYGNRLHGTRDPKGQLEEIVNSAADRGGKIIIPAFAVGRTQLLVYYLRELEDQGRIPVLPVAVDSPMAASVTRLYKKHSGEHDVDMRKLTGKRRDALSTRNFSLIHGRAESRKLTEQRGPGIIISASGMATGGRVLHHLARHLPDPKTTVVLVGFQAEGTRGRRLQEGETEVKIHGQMVPVNARVVGMSNLSAHADAGEILRWLSGFKRVPRATFVVHGEPEAAAALSGKIESELGWHATVPKYQDKVVLE